jgi:hypothetical protein
MTWSVGAGLEGRTVVVTGATSGIGRATSLALATAGALVVATDLDQAKLDDLLASMDEGPHRSAALNLTKSDDRQSQLELAKSDHHVPYALVHTAAVLRRRSDLDDITEDDWDATRYEPQGHVLPLSLVRERDEGSVRRATDPFHVAELDDRQLRRRDGLRGLEGRDRLAGSRSGTDAWPLRHHRELHRAGPDQHDHAAH